MSTIRYLKRLGVRALCAAALVVPVAASIPALADEGEDAIWARLGFMNLAQWEATPLYAMGKGTIPYDATAAKTHVDRLVQLYQYPYPELFLPGTSNADRPGKTRALPEIWQHLDQFQQRFQDLKAALASFAEQAGKGEPAFRAAFPAFAMACGGCHKDYRAENY